MTSTSRPARLALTCTAALMLGAVAAPPAQAQSRCGESYRISPGDTLYRVAQQCRVSLARIMDLNPGLGDPRDIEVGTRLALTAGDDGTRRQRDPGRGYRVESGDTMYSIAQRFGVSLFELLAANEDVQPWALAVGELLDIPGDGPAAGVSVSPSSGPAGSRVTVQAGNLRPGDYVTIGVGPQASEWSALREARVDADGTLRAEVRAPDRAEAGDDLIFVVDTDRGMTLKSGVFDVTGGTDRPERVTLRGRVREGAECPVLETQDGDRHALTSGDIRFTPGEYVEVTGTRAEAAFCMQGVDTIHVGTLDEVAPPREGGGNDGERIELEGRVRDGTECPLLVTPDGDRWSLVSDRIDFTPGEYIEVRGTRADMSFCMAGLGTVEVTGIDEVEPPARDRDPARAGGVRLDEGYVTGAWAAKGGDCGRPDFRIERTASGGVVVDATVAGQSRTGMVSLGSEPSFVFDRPRRDFPLESRGPDGLAVMPPDSGATELGGRSIRGDGRVYVKC